MRVLGVYFLLLLLGETLGIDTLSERVAEVYKLDHHEIEKDDNYIRVCFEGSSRYIRKYLCSYRLGTNPLNMRE